MSARALKRALADYKTVANACENKQYEWLRGIRIRNEAESNKNTDDSIFVWIVTLQPPQSSVYYPDTYDIQLFLSKELYPIKPPDVTIVTKIFSPIVDPKFDQLCENLIKQHWKPTLVMLSVLQHITHALFVDYANNDPLNEEASKLLAEGKLAEFKQRVKQERAQ